MSALSAQLGKVGGNLNQIAKSLNRGGVLNFMRRRNDHEIVTALRETQAAMDRIPSMLADVLERIP